MAEVVLFEDDAGYVKLVEKELADGGHNLIAQEATIQGALGVLDSLIRGEVSTDFIIVDGNLDDENKYERDAEPVQYKYEHPGEQELTIVREGLLRKKKEIWVPKVTVFELQRNVPQNHARMIMDIVKTTGIQAKTIGFSGDSMRDIPVDNDDAFKNPHKLNTIIDLLSQ